MISTKEKKEIVKRLHHIKGQLGGIEKMLDDDRPVQEIFMQLKAVEQALHQAIYVVLDDQIKKHFAEVLSKRLAECPGDCGDAGRLQFLRHEFAKLDLKDLLHEFNWLNNSRRILKVNKSKPRKEMKTK
jgi:DNA-binding FrmR family transcriptional regulator